MSKKSTVQCHCNTVSFLQNIHNIHPIARPWGWDMGCLLWVKSLMHVLPQSLQWWMHYCVLLHCLITALHCMPRKWLKTYGNLSLFCYYLFWSQSGNNITCWYMNYFYGGKMDFLTRIFKSTSSMLAIKKKLHEFFSQFSTRHTYFQHNLLKPSRSLNPRHFHSSTYAYLLTFMSCLVWPSLVHWWLSQSHILQGCH